MLHLPGFQWQIKVYRDQRLDTKSFPAFVIMNHDTLPETNIPVAPKK